MARYLERLKNLANLSDHQPAAPSASPPSMVESKSSASLAATDLTAKTAETAPTENFVSFVSSFETEESDFSRRTCGTCRHALRNPNAHSLSSWRGCGLGWMGGFADQWRCDDWRDATSMSPHDAQVNRAKALIEVGYSPSNAIAKAYGERVQGGRL